MQLHYNWLLVLLSYGVSVLGSFTALQLAVAIPLVGSPRLRTAVVAMASGAMGLGAIWAAHFVAMLACDKGLEVTYDASLTALSAVFAFAGCSAGMVLVGNDRFGGWRLWAAGACVGLGMASMHYTGMAAMMMPATIHYATGPVLASMLMAIVASTLALWLAFHLRGSLQMMGSALVMGAAVCAMHYGGMVAASFEGNGRQLPDGYADGLRSANLSPILFAMVAVLLLLAWVLHFWRQRYRSGIAI